VKEGQDSGGRLIVRIHSTECSARIKSRGPVSRLMAAAPLECLSDPKVKQDARAELNKYIAEFGYKEPLAADAKLLTSEEL